MNALQRNCELQNKAIIQNGYSIGNKLIAVTLDYAITFSVEHLYLAAKQFNALSFN